MYFSLRSISMVIAFALTLFTHDVLAQYRPTVGQPHSDFLLPRIDNRKPVSLSQFRGKKVLLIHFASW